jgi:hypothetical protein
LLLILLSRLVPLISLWEYNEAEGPSGGPTEPPALTLGNVRAAGSVEGPASSRAAFVGATGSHKGNSDMIPLTYLDSANALASISGGFTAEEGVKA